MLVRSGSPRVRDFDQFHEAVSPRVLRAVAAGFGAQVAADATSEAMAWAWESWERVQKMDNPAGCVYRVAERRAIAASRDRHRVDSQLREDLSVPGPDIEPGLISGLANLSSQQRTVVVLVVGFQWTQQEVADLLEISHSTVRTHLRRALERLTAWLGTLEKR